VSPSDELKRSFVQPGAAAGVSVVDIGLSTRRFSTSHRPWKLDAAPTSRHPNPIEVQRGEDGPPGGPRPFRRRDPDAARPVAERGDYESGAGELILRASQSPPRPQRYFDTIAGMIRPSRPPRRLAPANGVAGLYGPGAPRRLGWRRDRALRRIRTGALPLTLPDSEDEHNVET